MFRLLLGALALGFVALGAGADDKKDPKDKATTWVREVDPVKLTFEIGKDTATFHVDADGNGNGVVIKAKLTRDKDVITAEFTEVEEKGNFPNKPKKGDKISFKWVEKDDKATLSDFKGDHEGAKDLVEGEFKKRQ